MIAADGREVWLKDIVHLIVKDGTPVESIGLMVDITDKKRAEDAERQLDAARASQRQALQVNDSIVQGLAVAKYALELRLDDRAQEAVGDTLRKAREIVAGLLDDGATEGMEPAAFLTQNESDR